ncbi:MAG: PKD domain-containing protein [Candidatus Bipolaricaulota bacterium]|nr:PKD domain-containing protein [Candidatus Bipolaricaulota bacterium]
MRILRWYAVGVIAIALAGLSSVQPPPPALSLSPSVDPSTIFVKNSQAQPQIANVQLHLRADPLAAQPIDAIIGIDRSLPLSDVQRFVGDLIQIFGGNDRLGVVSLAPPTLDVPLTADFDLVRYRISELTPSGATGLAEALQLGTRELETNGRAEARKLQIWLIGRAGTDRADLGSILQQAQRAKARQVIVYVIAATSTAAGSATLLQLARTTDGLFLRGLSAETIATIKSRERIELVAREIAIRLELTPQVTFEQASGNPQIEDTPEGTKILRWALDRLGPEDTYTVTVGVSSPQKGSWTINRVSSSVEYTNILGQRVRLPIPPLTLTVTNAQPLAKFEFNPEQLTIPDRERWQPVVGETIVFRNQSSDPDGFIASYAWDFGDGTTSSEQNPTKRYDKPGTYTVRLTVTDDSGATASAEATITVVNIVTVTRDLPTFEGKFPRDLFVRVFLEIRTTRDLLGLGIQEKWPEGLVTGLPADITRKVLGESHGGNFKAAPDTPVLEWIFPERLPAGTVKKIVYEFKLSDKMEPKLYALEGMAISRLPEITIPTEGVREFELVEGLPIRVIVAHYVGAPDQPPEEERLDFKDDKLISFTQIQRAVSWWLDPNPLATVPGSGGKKIDLATMQELIAYWLSETPVDQPLPAQPPPP